MNPTANIKGYPTGLGIGDMDRITPKCLLGTPKRLLPNTPVVFYEHDPRSTSNCRCFMSTTLVLHQTALYVFFPDSSHASRMAQRLTEVSLWLGLAIGLELGLGFRS